MAIQIYLAVIPAVLAASLSASAADVKVAGGSIVPQGLVFSESDPSSRVSGEGELSDGCTWELYGETRVGRHRLERDKPEQDCLVYYYQTSVRLVKKCPPPSPVERLESERITSTGPHCPGSDGKIDDPKTRASAVSDGRIPDGRRQIIVQQPDGTRLTLRFDPGAVEVQIRYSDSTSDLLRLKAATNSE